MRTLVEPVVVGWQRAWRLPGLGWLLFFWIAVSVAMAINSPRGVGWEDAVNEGIIAGFPALLGSGVLAAWLAGGDRYRNLGRVSTSRPLGQHFATVVTAATVAGIPLMIAIGMAIGRFWARAQLRFFDPTLMLVAGSALVAWASVGAAVGALVPRWVGLPLMVIVAHAGLVLPAAQSDSWLALLSPIDNGGFLAGVDRPRPVVLIGQILGFVAIGVLAGCGDLRLRYRRGYPQWLGGGLVLLVSAALVLSVTGPQRAARENRRLPVTCAQGVCVLADRGDLRQAVVGYLQQRPDIRAQLALTPTRRLVDRLARPLPGDLVISLSGSREEAVVDALVTAWIQQRWCGPGVVNEPWLLSSPTFEVTQRVLAGERLPVNLPTPESVTCSAR